MPKSVNRIAGFDWLRVLALGLVLVFHILVLLDCRDWTKLAGMSLGAFGVSLFLGISGALIGGDSRDPSDWLISRLKKIYPAYWIATILAFSATAIAGYKPVSLKLFLWQLSGIGFFYAEDLINVATWFIGLLLALYFSVYLARLSSFSNAILQIFAIGAAILLMFNSSADYFGNCLVFYGALLAFRTPSPAKSLWLLMIPCIVLSLMQQEFLSTALVWGLLSIGLIVPRLPNLIAWISKYSYEFYLVHGIFLVGSMKLFRARGPGLQSLLAIAFGLAVTMIAAICIQWMSTFLIRKVNHYHVSAK